MIRFARRFGSAGLALLGLAVLSAGCVKSEEDETMVEFLEGNSREVTFLVGVKADPKYEAKSYCAVYGKTAVFRDVEPAGTVWESYTTGSRPYLYYFDCL